jgi:hypothetical protein
MSDISEITRSLFGQMHVKSSALNPLLWLAGLGGSLCFFAANFITAFAGWLICTGILCIVSPIIAYVYFAIKDPNRLQSEEYQIHQQKIQHQLRQGSQSIELISDTCLVANPALLQTSPNEAGSK